MASNTIRNSTRPVLVTLVTIGFYVFQFCLEEVANIQRSTKAFMEKSRKQLLAKELTYHQAYPARKL